MMYANEPRVLLGLLMAGLLPILAWSADRREPVEQLENVVEEPVRAGENAVVRTTVLRHRRCTTTFERLVFDSARIRTSLEPLPPFTAIGPLGVKDTFRQLIPIPAHARPGKGTIRFVISWSCNPIHSTLWPLVKTIDIPVEIVP